MSMNSSELVSACEDALLTISMLSVQPRSFSVFSLEINKQTNILRELADGKLHDIRNNLSIIFSQVMKLI